MFSIDAADNILKYGKTPYPVSGTTAVAIFSALTIVLVFLSSENKPNDNKEDKSESLKKNKKETHHSFTKSIKRKSNASDDGEKELSTLDEDESNMESNLINSQPNQPNNETIKFQILN